MAVAEWKSPGRGLSLPIGWTLVGSVQGSVANERRPAGPELLAEHMD